MSYNTYVHPQKLLGRRFSALALLLALVSLLVPGIAAAEAPVTLDVKLAVDGASMPADWPYIAPGKEIVWSYAVTNVGVDSINDLTIADALAGEVCAIATLPPNTTQECRRVTVAGETVYATTVRVLHTGDTNQPTLAQSSAGIQVLDDGSETAWLPASVGPAPAWPVERWAPPAAVSLLIAAALGWWLNRQVRQRQMAALASRRSRGSSASSRTTSARTPR